MKNIIPPDIWVNQYIRKSVIYKDSPNKIWKWIICLTFPIAMTWNDYIKSIAMSTSKKIGSLCRSIQFFSPESVCTFIILPFFAYHCYVWCVCYVFTVPGQITKTICNIIGPGLAFRFQFLSFRRNISFLYRLCIYVHGDYSFFVRQLRKFKRRISGNSLSQF